MAFNRKEYDAKWRAKNREHLREYAHQWYQNHPKECNEASTKWNQSNRNKTQEACKRWRSSNRHKIREYTRHKYATDPCFRMATLLRNRFKKVLNGQRKYGSVIKALGCSMSDFKKHIESLWETGMTWNNYGKEWNLDHIIPLAKFDLTDPNQLPIAFHYSNHQPLWKDDNMRKSDLHVLDFRCGMF